MPKRSRTGRREPEATIPEALLRGAFYFHSLEGVSGLPERLSISEFGRLYVAFYPEAEEDGGPEQETTWVWDLMYHLCHEAPGIALDCVVSAARQPLSKFQASCIAAGALEDIIADHGPEVIERIEELARESARFRYLLSGVWPRGQDTARDVWQRVLRARAPGPHMDKGARVPAVDL